MSESGRRCRSRKIFKKVNDDICAQFQTCTTGETNTIAISLISLSFSLSLSLSLSHARTLLPWPRHPCKPSIQLLPQRACSCMGRRTNSFISVEDASRSLVPVAERVHHCSGRSDGGDGDGAGTYMYFAEHICRRCVCDCVVGSVGLQNEHVT